MNIKEAWIKAAVEHQILKIGYYSKTKNEPTIRRVEPDYFGWDVKRINFGCWAAFDYLRRTGPRCFKPGRITSWKVTNRKFDPAKSHHRRWKQLIPSYKQLDLENKPWPNNKISE